MTGWLRHLVLYTYGAHRLSGKPFGTAVHVVSYQHIKSIYVAVVKVGIDEHEVRGYGRYKGYYHLKPRNFRGNTCKPGENHNLEGQSVF